MMCEIRFQPRHEIGVERGLKVSVCFGLRWRERDEPLTLAEDKALTQCQSSEILAAQWQVTLLDMSQACSSAWFGWGVGCLVRSYSVRARAASVPHARNHFRICSGCTLDRRERCRTR